jgi:hypothetical protein
MDLEARSRDMQERTFCKWSLCIHQIRLMTQNLMSHVLRLNTKLEAHQLAPMSNLFLDLKDGVRLIQLMVSDTTSLSLVFPDVNGQEIMGVC